MVSGSATFQVADAPSLVRDEAAWTGFRNTYASLGGAATSQVAVTLSVGGRRLHTARGLTAGSLVVDYEITVVSTAGLPSAADDVSAALGSVNGSALAAAAEQELRQQGVAPTSQLQVSSMEAPAVTQITLTATSTTLTATSTTIATTGTSTDTSSSTTATTTTDPCHQYGGLLHYDERTCCHSSCGFYCGAGNCNEGPGGGSLCCGDSIPDEVICSTSKMAPCSMATPTAGPSAETTAAPNRIEREDVAGTVAPAAARLALALAAAALVCGQ